MVSIDDTDWNTLWGNIYDTYGNEITNSNWSQVIAYEPGNEQNQVSEPVNSSSETYDFGGSGSNDSKLRVDNIDTRDPINLSLDSVNGPQMVVSPTILRFGASITQRDLVFPHGTFDENTKFNCSISAPSAIPVGSSTNIDVSVTNNGGNGTKEIELIADGSLVGSQSVTLSSGQSATPSFSYTPNSEGAITLEADIRVEPGGRYYQTDGYTSQTVDAANPSFDVSIVDTNSPLAGNTLDVTANISETAGVSGTKDVELSVDGSVQDTITVSLSGSGSKQKVFNWNTSSGDGGSYTATVSSPDTSDSSSVTVNGPSYEITVTGTNSPILSGNTLDVYADVVNNGGAGTETVTLDVGGSQRDSASISLGINGSTNRTFSWNTSGGDDGTYTATVSSPSNSGSSGVEINGPEFSVTITGTNSPVTARGTLNVTADVTNNGGAGTETVTLDVGGSQRDSSPLFLGINENDSYTLSWNTSESDVGSYTATYNSPSSSDTTSVSVEIPPPANLTVDNSVEDELTVGWDIVDNVVGYYVYRAQTSGSTTDDYMQVADVSSPPYTDTGLEDGERYYYRVSSYD